MTSPENPPAAEQPPVSGMPPIPDAAPETKPAPVEAPPTATATAEKPEPEKKQELDREELLDARGEDVLEFLQTVKDFREELRDDPTFEKNEDEKQKIGSIKDFKKAIDFITDPERKDIKPGLGLTSEIIKGRIREIGLDKRDEATGRVDEAIIKLIKATLSGADKKLEEDVLITDKRELLIFGAYLKAVEKRKTDKQEKKGIKKIEKQVELLNGEISDRENVIPDAGEAGGKSGVETAVASDTGEHPKPEAVPEPGENPIEVFKKLKEDKAKIDSDLGEKSLTKNEREVLLIKKEITSRVIIQEGCKILGRDNAQERDEWKRREEEQWQKSLEWWLQNIPQNGSQTLHERHVAYERAKLASNKKAMDARYDGIIKDSFLPKPWQENLLKGGEITIGKGRTISLGKEDAAVCLAAKLDLGKVKRSIWGHLRLSDKFEIGGMKFADLKGFNDYIAQKKDEYLNKAAEERAEQRKQLTIEGSIRQTVLDQRIIEVNNQIVENLKVKQEQNKIQKNKEKEEAKRSEAEALSPEDRFKKLNEMDAYYRKVKGTYKSLEAVRLGKRVKSGENTYFGLESSGKKLITLLHEYSDDVIRIAEELTGENIKRDAMISAGIDPEIGPQTKEEKAIFREKLTENVKAIFKEQAELVEKTTGKKIIRKSKKSLAMPAKEEADIISPDDLWEGTSPT